MYESLSPLDENELRSKCEELTIKLKEGLSKEDLMQLVIKKSGGVSKMKVNNQVASNPVGFYMNQARILLMIYPSFNRFTRTNFEKYNNGLPFIQHIDKLFQKLVTST